MQLRTPVRLLSIDWDYFFRIPPSEKSYLYDWGARETLFFRTEVWYARALGFQIAGVPLPYTTGDEILFRKRFRIREHAPIFVCDSHSCAVLPEVAQDVTHVVSYDAHHDLGYSGKRYKDFRSLHTWGADDWLAYYAVQKKAHITIQYPKWRTDFKTVDKTSYEPASLVRSIDDFNAIHESFDRVLICRSAAWTPPWLDDMYFHFVRTFSKHPQNIDDMNPLIPRTFDPKWIQDTMGQKLFLEKLVKVNNIDESETRSA